MNDTLLIVGSVGVFLVVGYLAGKVLRLMFTVLFGAVLVYAVAANQGWVKTQANNNILSQVGNRAADLINDAGKLISSEKRHHR